MLKNILNLNGSLELTRNEQKKVNGGSLNAQNCCDPSKACCNPKPFGSTSGCQWIFAVPGQGCV
jgi:hypothetical protein